MGSAAATSGGGSLVEIRFEGSQVVLAMPKAILVLTKAQFVEALKRGKAYRRQQARQARIKAREAPHG
jgi:4-diphosphocytidyl-2C-methyl-D-erythritol kinase